MCKDHVDTGGIDAARGTVQHYMGEQCLSRKWEPDRYLGETLSVCKDKDGEEFVLLGKDKFPILENHIDQLPVIIDAYVYQSGEVGGK